MLLAMAGPLGEVCSVTRRLLRMELGLQTSRRVNVFFPAKGQILFEQATLFYSVAITGRTSCCYEFMLCKQRVLIVQFEYFLCDLSTNCTM